MATGWSTYAVWRTINISDRLQHLVENPDTPCHFDLYRPYFTRRTSLQVRFTKIMSQYSPPQLSSSWRTLSCTGMPSLYRSSSPGAFTKYSFLSLTTREHTLLMFTRFIASRHLDAPLRRKTSCGCMQYGLVWHCTRAAFIDISFHSIFSQFWSASSYPFSS